ncbi:hypothetical protein [Streptomyces sp. NEAU-174]|uniref:hypothetical protein n=1 Tax=Streptomyces sp. NEAU-174 TaxID=3458254 RepID=UPI0040448AE5
MPEPSTSRLGLYKPLNDGSELVNVQQDLNQNWDKIDLAAGFQACTSTTRPSTPYSGKAIRETDTARTYVHNGSSPASAGWVQIPNSASTFDADLDLTSGHQLNIGGSSSSAPLSTVLSSASSNMISSRVSGDTSSRWLVNADGGISWGPGGAAALDVTLSRSGTGTLTLVGNLAVTGAGQERYVIKPSDTARTSVSTVADDPHLTATVVAGGIYLIRFVVFATTADPTSTDIRTAWNVPSGSTGLKLMHGSGDTAADFGSGTNTRGRFAGRQYSTTGSYQSEASAVAILEESIITIGGTAGSVTLQWSQTVSDTDAVTVLANSYMYIRRLA